MYKTITLVDLIDEDLCAELAEVMTDHQLKYSRLLKDSGKGPRTTSAEVPNSPNNNVSLKMDLVNCLVSMREKNKLWFYLQESQAVCKKEQ